MVEFGSVLEYRFLSATIHPAVETWLCVVTPDVRAVLCCIGKIVIRGMVRVDTLRGWTKPDDNCYSSTRLADGLTNDGFSALTARPLPLNGC